MIDEAEALPRHTSTLKAISRVGDVQRAGEASQLAIGLESDPAVRRFLQQTMNALKT